MGFKIFVKSKDCLLKSHKVVYALNLEKIQIHISLYLYIGGIQPSGHPTITRPSCIINHHISMTARLVPTR